MVFLGYGLESGAVARMIDYSLYLVTDKKLAGENPLTDIVASAIAGGVTIVQYREKNASTGEMITESSSLHVVTKKAGVPLIINDRVDICLAIDAEGVHVGQSDMPVSLVRKLIGSEKIIGVSVKTVEEAMQAMQEGVDYISAGDIFGTTTKLDAGAPIGLERVKEIAQSVSIPFIGIGGITKENAASVLHVGANGIAVISAIIGKPNPEQEARELKNIITL